MEEYFNTLPGEAALKEIKQNVANSLYIVSATLFDPKVSINWAIPHSAHDRSVLLIRHMLVSLNISEALAEPKVDQMDDMRFILEANQKVLWFQIAMHKILRM